MAQVPASVRHRNPGAQWPGPVADRWGSTGFETLADGQGNKIATFPTWEQGAAAHIDLLRSGYAGMPLDKAVEKWSGGNNSGEYLKRVVGETGLAPNTVISDELLRSPQGLALVKSMAGHEKGRNGEGISEGAWSKAFGMVYGGEAPPAQVAAAAPAQGGMLNLRGPTAQAEKAGGLLADLFGSEGAFRPAMAEQQPQQQPQKKGELDLAEESAAPELPQGQRRPVDMARVLAILQSRSRLGSA